MKHNPHEVLAVLEELLEERQYVTDRLGHLLLDGVELDITSESIDLALRTTMFLGEFVSSERNKTREFANRVAQLRVMVDRVVEHEPNLVER